MERNPLTDELSTRTSSPPRYRLRWDSRGLVLEERLPEGGYVSRATSAITFPPTPLAVSHPEMNTVLRQTLLQFLRGWLHGADTLSVTVSPPWGNAWSLPVQGLPEDEVREQVEWEMQQRLTEDLDRYIYAWNRVNGAAYAVAIHPDLLAFWEDLLAEMGLELHEFFLSAGLIDEDIEAEADLLPLLHLWRDREEQGLTHDQSDEHSLDLGDMQDTEAAEPAEPAVPIDLGDTDIVGAFSDLEDEASSRRRPLMLAVIAFVVVLVGSVGWLMRDRLFDFGGDDDGGLTDSAMVEQPASQEEAPVDVIEPPAQTDEQPPGETEPELPPATPAAQARSLAGETMRDVFASAARNNVTLHAVLLQGHELLIEGAGGSSATETWRQELANMGDVTLSRQRSRGGSYNLTTLTMPSGKETELSLTQFDSWAADLGMTSTGTGLYMADRAMIDRLLERMMTTGERPWRLSVHLNGNGRYTVMMMP